MESNVWEGVGKERQTVTNGYAGLMVETHEGGHQYEHTMDHHLEFFSKAGSLYDRKKRTNFYGDMDSALDLFKPAWYSNKELAMKLLFWCRDCRGGAGNRSGARAIYRWLAQNDPVWMGLNLTLVVETGRWDDLRSLFGTVVEAEAAGFWQRAISNGDVLAAKWADRKDVPLQRAFATNQAGLRKRLSALRNGKIVETFMCAKEWNGIAYEQVPSVAMSRYTKAFQRHDPEGFATFKNAVKNGEATIKAATLFPYDCVRTAQHGDKETADLQFDALPNYLEGTDEKIIVISDTSGSMQQEVAGSVQAFHVSQSLALYCSEKIGKGNPFYRKFIGFCSEGKWKDWSGKSFSQAVNNVGGGWNRDSNFLFDGAVGSTRIDKALDRILQSAIELGVEQKDMPTTLLIVSDMQFHQGSSGAGTEVEKALFRWTEAGYNLPKIVYWNTAGYAGSPARSDAVEVGLVSGFSPSTLKAVLTGDDFTPTAIMLRAVEKYKVTTP